MVEGIRGNVKLKSVDWEDFQKKSSPFLTIAGWILFILFLFIQPNERTIWYIPIALFIISYIFKKKWFKAITSSITSTILLFLYLEYGAFYSMIGTLILLPILITVYVIRYKMKKKKNK